VRALKQGRINMLVFDAPQVWWTAAREEASLQSFPELLNNESLAWAISKNNTALLEEVNAIMGKWKEDGTGERIFQNWFPAR
jgi:ABC-type amino acid transport substrate-binding protein